MVWRIAANWFDATRVNDRFTLIREPHVDPLLRCNMWHVRGRDRDLLVDGGLGIVSLRQAFPELFQRDVVAVATHRHVDHVGGLMEFDLRAAHAAESDHRVQRSIPASLCGADYPQEIRQALTSCGYPVADWLISALPRRGFDPSSFRQPLFEASWLIDEGDVIDLGDVVFRVLHLPGHSPGSIGLWQPNSGVLMAGDAVYDGPLIDSLPGADVGDYRQTMRRLQELPVEAVHGGHDSSFGRMRLRAIAAAYLKATS